MPQFVNLVRSNLSLRMTCAAMACWLVYTVAESMLLPVAVRRRAAVSLRSGPIPDWDSIRPEAEAKQKRAKEVAAKMAELREYKKQGRRYDGRRLEDTPRTTTGLDDEAGFSQLMNEAEAFFGGGSSPAAINKTSGVGGTWLPPAGDTPGELHRPTVSTWGRFPRPKDISKAYGGGRRIGVGAAPRNETLDAEKAATTAAKLAAYRQRSGAEQRVVDENRNRIETAIETAKRATRKGLPTEGVKALRNVQDVCTPRTRLGAEAMLELALCCEATGDFDSAKAIYAQLVLSPLSDVKRRAQQLSFGFEAQDRLGVESYAGSEASKMALEVFQLDFSSVSREAKTYVQSVDTKISTSVRAIDETSLSTPTEAVDLLRRAAVGGATFASPDRVALALDVISNQADLYLFGLCDDDQDVDGGTLDEGENDKMPFANPASDAVSQSDDDDESLTQAPPAQTGLDKLDGQWAVVFSIPRGNPSAAGYQPLGASISVDAASRTVSRRLPVLNGFLFVDWRGAALCQNDGDKALIAERRRVEPALFSALVDSRWQVDIKLINDRLCVLNDQTQLFLCKRQPTKSI